MKKQIFVTLVLVANLTVLGIFVFKYQSFLTDSTIKLTKPLKQVLPNENIILQGGTAEKIIPGIPLGPFPTKGPYNNSNLKLLAQKVAVKTAASEHKAVIICVLDASYVEMFYTFVESAQIVGLKNVLPVTLTKEASEQLNSNGFPNFHAENINGVSNSENSFQSEKFNKKSSWKFITSLKLLELGYSVLALDLDIFFLKDPFSHFVCIDCDFELQVNLPKYEYGDICVGIVFYKPTLNAILFLKQLTSTMTKNSAQWDQSLFKQMISEWKAKLKINFLPFSTFPSGQLLDHLTNALNYYLPQDPCIVMYHNNWVTGIQAKEYRAKELGIWLTDTNQYYTSLTRKYMTYSNTVVGYQKNEMKVLEKAYRVADILNRTLVLPRFHSKLGTLEHLQGGYRFISKHKWNFREHSFLKHYKVPDKVKQSISNIIFVETADANVELEDTAEVYKVKPNSNVLTLNELITLNKVFEDVSVMKFHSLYFEIDFNKKELLI